MAQNPDFKDKVQYANTNLVGLSPNDVNSSEPSSPSNWVKNSWGTADRFRGVMGSYLYLAGSLANSLEPFRAVDVTGNHPLEYRVDGPATSTSTYSISYGTWFKDSITYLLYPNHASWATGVRALNLNLATDTFGTLLKQDVLIPGLAQGIPWWKKFMTTGFSSDEVGGSAPDVLHNVGKDLTDWAPFSDMGGAPGIFTGGTGGLLGFTNFYDFTFSYLKPSNDEKIRKKSGLDVRVDSIYNFYLDTTPPYEDATKNVAESMITNFYCLESELRNTGSSVNSQDYYNQITLEDNLGWFVVKDLGVGGLTEEQRGQIAQAQATATSTEDDLGSLSMEQFVVTVQNAGGEQPEWFNNIQGGVSSYNESTTAEFYSLYSKGIGGAGNSMSLLASMTTKYKNMVILCSDLDILSDLAVRDDDTSGVSNLPFYNKITIGVDDNDITGGELTVLRNAYQNLEGGSFFKNLLTDMAASGHLPASVAGGNPASEIASLLDIMQVYIIAQIEGDAHLVRNFKKASRWRTTSAGWSREVVDETSRRYFSWQQFMRAMSASPANPNAAAIPVGASRQEIIDRINNNITTNDNFVLLRNYNEGLTPARPSFLDTLEILNSTNNIRFPTRTYEQILANEDCYSEPILYKIDKYLVDGANDTLSQTFYISARGANWEPRVITYIDSQVRYGVEYRYDIKQIRMVFGSKYGYDDLRIAETAAAGYGRQLGNALGFYRPTDPSLRFDDSLMTKTQIPGKSYVNADEDTPQSLLTAKRGGDPQFAGGTPDYSNMGAPLTQRWIAPKSYLRGNFIYKQFSVGAQDWRDAFVAGRPMPNLVYQTLMGRGTRGNVQPGYVGHTRTVLDFLKIEILDPSVDPAGVASIPDLRWNRLGVGDYPPSSLL